MKRNLAMIKKEIEIFKLLFLGDGVTISRCPMLNILDSGKNIPVAILEIVTFSRSFIWRKKNMGHYFVIDFETYERDWPNQKLSDIVMFDGSSNFKIMRRLLKVHYPTLTVMHGVEHTVSLFFNDVSKIPIVYQKISNHKMIYNIFGSSIYHKPHFILK